MWYVIGIVVVFIIGIVVSKLFFKKNVDISNKVDNVIDEIKK
jgi:hypothetical protein